MVFMRHRLAVFVDGDFWHGRNWEQRQAKLRSGHNPSYWVAKIAYNRARDQTNDEAIRAANWRVMRLWESDVIANPGAAARRVLEALN